MTDDTAPCPMCFHHIGKAEWDDHYDSRHPDVLARADFRAVAEWYYGYGGGESTLTSLAARNGWEYREWGEDEAPRAGDQVAPPTYAKSTSSDSLVRALIERGGQAWTDGDFALQTMLYRAADRIESPADPAHTGDAT